MILGELYLLNRWQLTRMKEWRRKKYLVTWCLRPFKKWWSILLDIRKRHWRRLQLHFFSFWFGILWQRWIGQRISNVSSDLLKVDEKLKTTLPIFRNVYRELPAILPTAHFAMCWQEGMRQLLLLLVVSLSQFLNFNSMQEADKVKWELFFPCPSFSSFAVPPVYTHAHLRNSSPRPHHSPAYSWKGAPRLGSPKLGESSVHSSLLNVLNTDFYEYGNYIRPRGLIQGWGGNRIWFWWLWK